MNLGKGPPARDVIERIRISSNTKQSLADNHTLIVNQSTGIAPERGVNEFKVRYQLNEDSNMIHKINDAFNNSVWKEELRNASEGTRGFDWDGKEGKKGNLYRALVEATSKYDPDIWDHDLSRKFEILK
jgi:flagellar hook assembly protein FlgD